MAQRRIRKCYWVDFRHNGVRYRKKSPINTKAGAAEYEIMLRIRLARGEDIDAAPARPSPPVAASFETFASFSARWLAGVVTNDDKPTTVRTKRSIVRIHLLPSLGKKHLRDITSSDVEAIKTRLRETGKSAKTTNNILTVLSSCLRAAHEDKLLDELPRFKLVKKTPQPFDFLTFDEADRVLALPMSTFWRTFVLCALRTGMRRGELRGLQWSDVNFTARTITVRHSFVEGVLGTPKTEKTRVIPIAPDLDAELRTQGPGEGYVFTVDGGPLGEHRMYLALERFCERLELRPIGWHTMRHTFASHLVMRGVPIRHVQLLMGHSSVEMTERYAHLAPSSLESAVSVLCTPPPTLIQFGQPAVPLTVEQGAKAA
ncbi:MAG: tyrosine-type recombinase/integrase [Patescibacteria group bacterium]